VCFLKTLVRVIGTPEVNGIFGGKFTDLFADTVKITEAVEFLMKRLDFRALFLRKREKEARLKMRRSKAQPQGAGAAQGVNPGGTVGLVVYCAA